MVDAALKALAITLFAGVFGSLGAYLALKVRRFQRADQDPSLRRRAVRIGVVTVWTAAIVVGLVTFGIFL